MNEPQILLEIKLKDLLPRLEEYKNKGYRLVQICCVKLETDVFELDYSLEKEYDYHNLKVIFNRGTEIPSVSRIYLAAFLYENEIHDQFGVTINDIAVDYQGKFFKIAKPAPFDLPVEKKVAAPNA